MKENDTDKGTVDKTNVVTISHILIRDPDTGKTIISQRDKESKKNND